MMCGMPHPNHRTCKTKYAHTASHSVNGCVDYIHTLRLGNHFNGSYRCPMLSFKKRCLQWLRAHLLLQDQRLPLL